MVRHTLKILHGTLSMKDLTSQFIKPRNYATEDDLARVRKSG